jgi:hypothetical protein
MIGTLLGWGIGAAGMRAALSARDKVLLKSSLQVARGNVRLLSPSLLLHHLTLACTALLALQTRTRCLK